MICFSFWLCLWLSYPIHPPPTQATVRGRMDRKKAAMLKAKAALERRRRDAAVRRMQAIYRGHRGRLSTWLVMMQFREVKQKQHKAARTLQRFWQRAKVGSAALKASTQNLLLLVGRAKMFTQYWDDSVKKYFYHNTTMDESLWEPPESGYISKDGAYVLANGLELKPTASARLALASWKKFMDDDSKKPFWYNSATGVTAWSNPLPAGAPDLPFSDESEMDRVAEADGGDADGHGSRGGGGRRGKGEGEHEDDDDWGRGEALRRQEWEQYVDDDTGQPYWANAEGETTWENPYDYM